MTGEVPKDEHGHGSNGKLTGERAERIFVAIRQGVTMEAAALYCGVDKTTFYDWVKRGRKVGSRNPYRSFVLGLDEALAAFEVLALADIEKAGREGEWQASAWRLERRYPDKYGRRTRIDAQVNVTAVPMIDVSKLTPDELETLGRILAKAAPAQEELKSDQRPALELLPGDAVAL